ncbi:TVA4 protein, partial [Tachuris rubrigastra]|nr:TVA4 protein [Tachuris rubrigastra]
LLAVAAGRARVQQETSVESTEGTEITINCSHPNIQTGETVIWYCQLPDRGPKLLALAFKGSRDLPDKAGQLSVSPDRR